MSVNKVFLLGRLGSDPELKHTPSGMAVCNFSLATTETWSKDGKKQEKTEWSRIVVWGKLGEVCNQYLKKGSQAFVEGKLVTRSWEDKEGNKRYTTEVSSSSVQFINGNSDRNEALKKADDMSQQDMSVKTDGGFAPDEVPF